MDTELAVNWFSEHFYGRILEDLQIPQYGEEDHSLPNISMGDLDDLDISIPTAQNGGCHWENNNNNMLSNTASEHQWANNNITQRSTGMKRRFDSQNSTPDCDGRENDVKCLRTLLSTDIKSTDVASPPDKLDQRDYPTQWSPNEDYNHEEPVSPLPDIIFRAPHEGTRVNDLEGRVSAERARALPDPCGCIDRANISNISRSGSNQKETQCEQPSDHSNEEGIYNADNREYTHTCSNDTSKSCTTYKSIDHFHCRSKNSVSVDTDRDEPLTGQEETADDDMNTQKFLDWAMENLLNSADSLLDFQNVESDQSGTKNKGSTYSINSSKTVSHDNKFLEDPLTYQPGVKDQQNFIESRGGSCATEIEPLDKIITGQHVQQCNMCFLYFRDDEYLLRHIKEYHSDENCYHCPKCAAKLDDLQVLEDHIKVHSLISNISSDDILTENSTNQVTRTQDFVTCSICQALFQFKESLLEHYKEHQLKQAEREKNDKLVQKQDNVSETNNTSLSCVKSPQLCHAYAVEQTDQEDVQKTYFAPDVSKLENCTNLFSNNDKESKNLVDCKGLIILDDTVHDHRRTNLCVATAPDLDIGHKSRTPDTKPRNKSDIGNSENDIDYLHDENSESANWGTQHDNSNLPMCAVEEVNHTTCISDSLLQQTSKQQSDNKSPHSNHHTQNPDLGQLLDQCDREEVISLTPTSAAGADTHQPIEKASSDLVTLSSTNNAPEINRGFSTTHSQQLVAENRVNEISNVLSQAVDGTCTDTLQHPIYGILPDNDVLNSYNPMLSEECLALSNTLPMCEREKEQGHNTIKRENVTNVYNQEYITNCTYNKRINVYNEDVINTHKDIPACQTKTSDTNGNTGTKVVSTNSESGKLVDENDNETLSKTSSGWILITESKSVIPSHIPNYTTYKCLVCNLGFMSEHVLRRHAKAHRRTSKNLRPKKKKLRTKKKLKRGEEVSSSHNIKSTVHNDNNNGRHKEDLRSCSLSIGNLYRNNRTTQIENSALSSIVDYSDEDTETEADIVNKTLWSKHVHFLQDYL